MYLLTLSVIEVIEFEVLIGTIGMASVGPCNSDAGGYKCYVGSQKRAN